MHPKNQTKYSGVFAGNKVGLLGDHFNPLDRSNYSAHAQHAGGALHRLI